MLHRIAFLLTMVVPISACALQSHAQLRNDLRRVCWPEDGETFALGTFVASGEEGRRALLQLAHARNWQDAECGIGALSMLGDDRVIPAFVSKLNRPNSGQNPIQLVLSRALQLSVTAPLTDGVSSFVAALEKHLGGPYGFHAFATIGHIDHPDARAVVTQELRTASDERLAHAILAAGIRGQPDAQEYVRQAIGRVDLQIPDRRRWIAFYFLTLDSKTIPNALAMLDGVSDELANVTAAWAVQTLCLRSKRLPQQFATLEDHRRELIRQFEGKQIDWRRAPFGVRCD